MCSFLQQLCILQSIDKFELFTLHSLHVSLVLGLVISLAIQLFFKLLAGVILALHEVELTLLDGLLLLSHNHVLHVAGLVFFHCSLLLVALSSGFFFHLSFQSGLFLSLLGSHLALCDSFYCCILGLSILLAFHLFVHLMFTHAVFFGLLVHDVALALRHDLGGPFPCFIDFLHDLSYNEKTSKMRRAVLFWYDAD